MSSMSHTHTHTHAKHPPHTHTHMPPTQVIKEPDPVELLREHFYVNTVNTHTHTHTHIHTRSAAPPHTGH
jgi:hypothetical protein